MDSLSYFWLCTRLKMRQFLTDEDGEVNIVATVVLIGVAICLAVVFKDEIAKLISGLIGTAKTKGAEVMTAAPKG